MKLPENAIKLAILNHPQTFGLTEAEVNPMLGFVQHCMEHGEEKGPVELWRLYFEAVNTTLHKKVVEVFTGLSAMQGRAQDAAIAAESGNEAAPEPQPSPSPAGNSGNGELAGNAGASGASSGKLTPAQLRKIGFLLHQLGKTPDYKNDISLLSRSQATQRIKDLEAKVNAR